MPKFHSLPSGVYGSGSSNYPLNHIEVALVDVDGGQDELAGSQQ